MSVLHFEDLGDGRREINGMVLVYIGPLWSAG